VADNFRFVQNQATTLYGAGASAGDATLKLQSFTMNDGTPLTMAAHFGTIGFGTIEPGSASQEEQIAFTGITQNADGTATLTGVVNVGDVYPYTQTAGLAKNHPGGVTFVVSLTAGFLDKMTSKADDETIDGSWEFTKKVQMDAGSDQGSQLITNVKDPVSAQDAATKAYVLSIVSGGAVTFDQNVISGTSGEALAVGNIVYFKESDQRWWKTDADAFATADQVKIGIVQTVAGGAGVQTNILIGGLDKTQAGLVAGTKYYLSGTAAALTATPGVISRFIGWAVTATTLLVAIDELPTNCITGLSGAALTVGQVVYLKESDGRWYVAKADALSTSVGLKIGICQVAAGGAGVVTIIRIAGVDKTQTGLTAGTRYYISSSTGGALASTAQTFPRLVGVATSTNELLMTASDEDSVTVHGQQIYGASSGGTDTYAVTLPSAPIGYYAGMTVRFKADVGNTGAATLNVNGLGAVAIKKNVSDDLATGDIRAGAIVVVVHDGTNFQMVAPDKLFIQNEVNIYPLAVWAPIGKVAPSGHVVTDYGTFGGATTLPASEPPGLLIPFAGTVKTLYALAGQAGGTGSTMTIKVRKNASDTTMTVSFSGGVTSLQTDSAHPFTVAVGDLLTFSAAFNDNSTGSDYNLSAVSLLIVPTQP